jgi:hypothetical protein
MADGDDNDEPLCRRMSWRDLVMIPLMVAADVSDAVATGVEVLLKAVIAHDNYCVEQRSFANEIRLGLESIPEGSHQE